MHGGNVQFSSVWCSIGACHIPCISRCTEFTKSCITKKICIFLVIVLEQNMQPNGKNKNTVHPTSVSALRYSAFYASHLLQRIITNRANNAFQPLLQIKAVPKPIFYHMVQ